MYSALRQTSLVNPFAPHPRGTRISFSVLLALVLVLFVGSGCITSHVVDNKATSHWEYDKEKEESVQVGGQSAYYALLPLTVAADIATSPFQLSFCVLFSITGDGP